MLGTAFRLLLSLRTLDLRHNQLEEAPLQLSKLPLTRLDLSHNRLRGFPDCGPKVEETRTALELANAAALEAPWACLTRLDLSHNELESLPDSLVEHATKSVREPNVYALVSCVSEELKKSCSVPHRCSSRIQWNPPVLQRAPPHFTTTATRLEELFLDHNFLGALPACADRWAPLAAAADGRGQRNSRGPSQRPRPRSKPSLRRSFGEHVQRLPRSSARGGSGSGMRSAGAGRQ
jgi:Leucine-rich repeat (LRR) protein